MIPDTHREMMTKNACHAIPYVMGFGVDTESIVDRSTVGSIDRKRQRHHGGTSAEKVGHYQTKGKTTSCRTSNAIGWESHSRSAGYCGVTGWFGTRGVGAQFLCRAEQPQLLKTCCTAQASESSTSPLRAHTTPRPPHYTTPHLQGRRVHLPLLDEVLQVALKRQQALLCLFQVLLLLVAATKTVTRREHENND